MNNNKIENLKKVKNLLLQIDEKELVGLTEEELLNPDDKIITTLKIITKKNTIERLDLNL